MSRLGCSFQGKPERRWGISFIYVISMRRQGPCGGAHPLSQSELHRLSPFTHSHHLHTAGFEACVTEMRHPSFFLVRNPCKFLHWRPVSWCSAQPNSPPAIWEEPKRQLKKGQAMDGRAVRFARQAAYSR